MGTGQIPLRASVRVCTFDDHRSKSTIETKTWDSDKKGAHPQKSFSNLYDLYGLDLVVHEIFNFHLYIKPFELCGVL